MMAKVEEVQRKVHNILTSEFGTVTTDKEGAFRFPYQSTVVNVRVEEFGTDETLVKFDGLIAMDSKSGASVYEWCNENNESIAFGTIVHLHSGKNNLTILKHAILGDFLDPAELMTALKGIVLLADDLDDKFISQFGGKRYEDI
jgi:hypothetical protein